MKPKKISTPDFGYSLTAAAILAAALFIFTSAGGGAVSPIKPAPDPAARPTAAALAAIGDRLHDAADAGPASKPTADTAQSLSGTQPFAPLFLDRAAVTARIGAGKLLPGMTAFERALAFVLGNPDLFGGRNPERGLRALDEISSSDGRRHLRLEQLAGELPLWGSQLVFHFDADGSLYAVNGRYSPAASEVDPAGFVVSRESALARALDAVADRTVFSAAGIVETFDPTYAGPTADRAVLAGPGGTFRAVWIVEMRPNLRERWRVFVDARDGAAIEAYNIFPTVGTPAAATASDALGVPRTLHVTLDTGVYYLSDMDANLVTYDAHGKVFNSLGDISIISSTTNAWKDSIAVSAQANGRDVYDYYLSRHGRDGLDGKRMQTPLIVHYTDTGAPYYNAFWAGRYMAFGDGLPFARALDVVAHEMTHGVIQFTAGLDYRYQPGAINEGLADVMACMVDPDWLVGEDLPGGAIRDLEHPEKYGIPGTMTGYKNMPLSQDNGGVHENMGIPSHAFELAATATGREKTARIVYHMLDALYLTPQAQFIDLRLAAVQSSTDLFGADSPETAAVKTSFDTVGILNAPPTTPPVDLPVQQGGEWLAFVDTDRIGLVQPGSGTTIVLHPSRSRVFTGTARPMSVSKDGKLLIFVDSLNDLRSLNLDTNAEKLIDAAGIWSSVALSPDGKRLAATSIYADTTIYIFNFENPSQSKAITLYTPSTEGVKSPTAIFADAIDWDKTNSQLLYDVFHSLPVKGGTPVEFWDVNLLDVDSEVITRVKTPTENSFQVGNPAFGETNDRYMLCDLFSDVTKYNAVTAFDLYTMKQVEINTGDYLNFGQGPFPNVGIPRYAPDDRSVVFQRYNKTTGVFNMFNIPLGEDKMTPSGAPAATGNGESPCWFVRGAASGTGDETRNTPVAFELHPNAPNPFNSSTVVSFALSKPGRAELAVYDILGRKAAVLADGFLGAGEHAVRFDAAGFASGVYFLRLRVGGAAVKEKMTILR